MLIKSKTKKQAKNLQHNYTLMNIDIDEINHPDVQYEVHIPYDTLLVYYGSEVQIISLSTMKVERIIDCIPCNVTSVGISEDGIYIISSNRRQSDIILYERKAFSEPIHIAVESRIL